MNTEGTNPPRDYCTRDGKVRHPSRKIAMENLNRVRRGHDRSGKDRRACGKLNVYPCVWCGGWHLGNDDPEVTKARQQQKRRPLTGDQREDAA